MATLNVSGAVTTVDGIKTVTINGKPVTVNSDGSFSSALTLTVGHNIITVVATNNAGVPVTDTRSITYDTTVPELTITTPADNSAVAQPLLTVRGHVGEHSLVDITVNSTGPQAAIVDNDTYSAVANLSAGINTIEITVTDMAGHASSAKRTATLDTTKSALAITAPAQDITTDQNTLTIQGTVSDNQSSVTVSVIVDGQTFTPTITKGAFQQQIRFKTAKLYPIVVTATDGGHNRTTVQRNVIFTGVLGDCNDDGNVDVFDALRTLQYAVGLIEHTPENNAKFLSTADVAPDANGNTKRDGQVNVFDALSILRHSVGMSGW